MSKDYYKILGVEKSATQDEIKQAFRKKAHEYHPDKGTGDEAKFKEVNEAYQVLKDETKRKQYDQFGAGFNQAGFGGGQAGFGGMNWEDVMRQAGDYGSGGTRVNFNGFDFDLGDIFGDFFGGSRGSTRGGSGSRRGRDFEYQMEIDIKESAFGAEKTIELEKMDVCEKCNGKGYDQNAKIETCKQCGGSGQITQQQRTLFGTFATKLVCPTCQGEGKKPDRFCDKCHGQGRVQVKKKLKVEIPAGINDGESIKLSGQGEAGQRGASAGDLYISFRVKPDNKFERAGYDILSKVEVNIAQAALGDEIMVETLEGPVRLKVPAGIQSGNVLKMKGKGTEKLHGRGRGDQLVEVKVIVPEKLSKKSKKILEELKAELGN